MTTTWNRYQSLEKAMMTPCRKGGNDRTRSEDNEAVVKILMDDEKQTD